MTLPIVLKPGEGEGNAVGTINFALKATGDDTNGAYSLVEAGGPAFATPHVHHNREESFYVVEGSATFLCGEETVDAPAGSFLLVPRGTMHAFRCTDGSRLLIVHSPGGFEEFFRELSAAVERGEFDTAYRDRLGERLGMTYHDEVQF